MVHDSLVPTAGRRPAVVVAGGEGGPRLLGALVVPRAVCAQPSADWQVLYGTYLVSSFGRIFIYLFIYLFVGNSTAYVSKCLIDYQK